MYKKICTGRGGGCILNCLSYHPYLAFLNFADLLSLHLTTFFTFLFIGYHFLPQVTTELKFSIEEQKSALTGSRPLL